MHQSIAFVELLLFQNHCWDTVSGSVNVELRGQNRLLMGMWLGNLGETMIDGTFYHMPDQKNLKGWLITSKL